MPNPYYTHGGTPATRSSGSSAAIRAEFDLIQAAFDKLPNFSGQPNRLLRSNAAGDSFEVQPYSFAGSSNGSNDSPMLAALEAEAFALGRAGIIIPTGVVLKVTTNIDFRVPVLFRGRFDVATGVRVRLTAQPIKLGDYLAMYGGPSWTATAPAGSDADAIQRAFEEACRELLVSTSYRTLDLEGKSLPLVRTASLDVDLVPNSPFWRNKWIINGSLRTAPAFATGDPLIRVFSTAGNPLHELSFHQIVFACNNVSSGLYFNGESRDNRLLGVFVRDPVTYGVKNLGLRSVWVGGDVSMSSLLADASRTATGLIVTGNDAQIANVTFRWLKTGIEVGLDVKGFGFDGLTIVSDSTAHTSPCVRVKEKMSGGLFTGCKFIGGPVWFGPGSLQASTSLGNLGFQNCKFDYPSDSTGTRYMLVAVPGSPNAVLTNLRVQGCLFRDQAVGQPAITAFVVNETNGGIALNGSKGNHIRGNSFDGVVPQGTHLKRQFALINGQMDYPVDWTLNVPFGVNVMKMESWGVWVSGESPITVVTYDRTDGLTGTFRLSAPPDKNGRFSVAVSTNGDTTEVEA